MITLPAKFNIPMTPTMFAKIHTTVKHSHEVQSYIELGPATGSVVTHDADFAYAFDGDALCVVTVTSLNTWLARHASTGQIQSHIQDEMAKLAQEESESESA